MKTPEIKKETLLTLVIISLVFSCLSLLIVIKGHVKNDYDKRYHKKYGDLSMTDEDIMLRRDIMREIKTLQKKRTGQKTAGGVKTQNEGAMMRTELEDFVHKGIGVYLNSDSLESFLRIVNDPNGIFNNDLTYLFVIDANNNVNIGNAAFPEMVGTDTTTEYGSSPGQRIADKATFNGVWIEYQEHSDAYVVILDNLVFGASYSHKKESGSDYKARQ